MMTEASDGALVSRTQAGQVRAFGELVYRYQTSVFNVCFRMLGERREAEDLAQEAFLRAFQRLETFDVEREFGPWIRRVAANLCLNHLQKRRVVQMPIMDERDGPRQAEDRSPEAIHIHREQRDVVHAAILALPAHYRAVIELRHFQELSYAEIGEQLKLSLNEVRTHLYRARKSLAEQLKTHG